MSRIIALAVILLAAIVAAGCETWFKIDVTITDCATQAPLADVTAVLTVVGSSGRERTRFTGANGKLHMEIDAADWEIKTLTLTKADYVGWSHQFDAAPDDPFDICLDSTAGTGLR